ncbi:MAG: CRISPR-associated helicase Cas3' [Armatimonadota bacterium]
MDFDAFFRRATADLAPFPYQCEIAGRDALPWLLDAPTGAGKTAAAVLGWVWRRHYHPDAEVRRATPRRLVYCLPMRVLVEQTVRNAREWLARLDLLATRPGQPGKVGVYQLMGGEVQIDWDTSPEAEAILIGTQDQLLSRALNRGYSMSRYRWPVHFALLNSDCLWVMDEVQLMGAGLPTTSQLLSFREQFGTNGPAGSLWMSATLRTEDLATVDAPTARELAASTLSLSPADLAHPELSRRMSAAKTLHALDLSLSASTERSYSQALAEAVIQEHKPGSVTLVVLNQVRRAQELARALRDQRDWAEGELLLVHSRFRPAERRTIEERIAADVSAGGRVIVATQAIEAGVDLSARTLFTELAPWSSLVQRFGRCNRRGEWTGADASRVYWIDLIDLGTDSKPYDEDTLGLARDLLSGIKDVGIASVRDVVDPTPSPATQVLRRRDLLELFDTTPDLAGNDIDVSPYIREVEDLDVSVAWRDLEDETQAAPVPEELCSVSLRLFREFLDTIPGDGTRGPVAWDGLDSRWLPVDRPRPGMIVLVDADAGGYDPALGWWPESRAAVPPVEAAAREVVEAEAYDDDHLSTARRMVTLGEHLADVAAEVEVLIERLSLDSEVADHLRTAAQWHDLGKAHPYFQQLLLAGLPADDPRRQAGPWAKPDHFVRGDEAERPHFRHELASALAMVQHGVGDLPAYLVASHHGKVRMSIRSLPGERHPDDASRFARGVWEGDVLPAVTLPDGTEVPETVLSLAVMELGLSDAGPSWLERALALRDRYGPFRLAFLEALLRIADWRASAREREADD